MTIGRGFDVANGNQKAYESGLDLIAEFKKFQERVCKDCVWKGVTTPTCLPEDPCDESCANYQQRTNQP